MARLAQPLILIILSIVASAQTPSVRVGAKHFNEGYILSEMIALVLEDGGFTVERKFNLGGTAVTYEALRNGAIDVYPEYTGTIASEILKSDRSLSVVEINEKLKSFDLSISSPYGFSNTYALLIDVALSEKYNIQSISDLRFHPRLAVGLSYEFLKRKDGWENLARQYALPQEPIALEHGLAYQAILDHKIDVTDAYSTDGEILKYGLMLLRDDEHFFPEYQAVSFYRGSLPTGAKELLQKLSGAVSQKEMQQLNAQALFENADHKRIAYDFLSGKGLIRNIPHSAGTGSRAILQKTWVHLKLTLLALFCSIIVAVPIGLMIYRNSGTSRIVLYATGILQTIPSIALLALMIPLLGIGMLPAVIALFLYALLPILRNTVQGLLSVDPVIENVASAIGLNDWNKLWRVELPLAMPTIMSGIRTAAVINIGTATLAAFIGAGGLQGAIPSALLAIFMELFFEGISLLILPRYLRHRRSS